MRDNNNNVHLFAPKRPGYIHVQLHAIIMIRNPIENRKTFSSELLFSLMPLLLRLGRGKLASGQWPVRIPKFMQPRHVRVGVEIHYLTLASGSKNFSPILFMHMHRTSCFFNVKPGYHTYTQQKIVFLRIFKFLILRNMSLK